VIYGALEEGAASLWRIRIDGATHPERIEVAGNAECPAIAPSGARLAFSRNLGAESAYRFEPGRPSRPLVTSSLFEGGGLDFSPDGQRIAYCAAGSDEGIEIWTAKTDGSTAQQLTHGPGRWQCSPHWSPDGRQVAFDSQGADGHWHIWIIAADGGAPRQVTKDQGDQNVPSWSRDGQWVYYSGDEGSGKSLWRMKVADGRKQRLTHESVSLGARESADGKSVIYRAADGGLRAVALAGGVSRQILPCVAGWATSSSGLYYAACAAGNQQGGSNPALHVVDQATGNDRVMGVLEKYESGWVFGLAVSPDGKVIVYDRALREGHDLMLIENFK
jgi:Tol biopolymer transport system component